MQGQPDKLVAGQLRIGADAPVVLPSIEKELWVRAARIGAARASLSRAAAEHKITRRRRIPASSHGSGQAFRGNLRQRNLLTVRPFLCCRSTQIGERRCRRAEGLLQDRCARRT
jgi:hypothetical protein